MKNLLMLFILLSIAVFTSCDREGLEEQNTLTHQDDHLAKVDFTVDNKDQTLLERDALLLTNNSINAVSYHWDFGNGDTSSEAQPDYQYKIHGYYTVTLTITDIHGNTKTTSQEILVLCLFGGEIHDQ